MWKYRFAPHLIEHQRRPNGLTDDSNSPTDRTKNTWDTQINQIFSFFWFIIFYSVLHFCFGLKKCQNLSLVALHCREDGAKFEKKLCDWKWNRVCWSFHSVNAANFPHFFRKHFHLSFWARRKGWNFQRSLSWLDMNVIWITYMRTTEH